MLAVYRWLALLPPVLTLLQSRGPDRLEVLLLLLVIVESAVQTTLYFRLRPVLGKDFVYSGSNLYPGQTAIIVSVVLGLLVSAVLLSPQNTPYMLYALAPVFSCALFSGAAGALTGALILAASYLAARLSFGLLSGQPVNWQGSFLFLCLLFLIAGLSGYLVMLAEQLRSYAIIIERYRGNLEQQNNSLERTNQQLEYVSDFNRVLQQGATIPEVEQLATSYLTNLLTQLRAGLYRHTPQPFQHQHKVRLLTEDELQKWLNLPEQADAPLSSPAFKAGSSNNFIRIARNGETFWLLRLNYRGEKLGGLLLPGTGEASDKMPEPGPQEKLLIALLAGQLANVLGNLRQSQALAVEAERTRLAMDMHDIVAQSLFGIAYNLDACLKLMDRNPAASRERLADLKTLAFDTLSNVRTIIYDLSNEESGGTDFAAFLQSYLKRAGQLYPFKINLQIRATPQLGNQNFKLETEVQKNLYRLLREALSNASKHSGATEVWIELVRTLAGLSLNIRDNGRGFTPESVTNSHMDTLDGATSVVSGGLGLKTMQERAKQIGAELHLESAPGRGTAVVVYLPLKA